jgi:hypothetical protein
VRISDNTVNRVGGCLVPLALSSTWKAYASHVTVKGRYPTMDQKAKKFADNSESLIAC